VGEGEEGSTIRKGKKILPSPRFKKGGERDFTEVEPTKRKKFASAALEKKKGNSSQGS